MLVTRSLIYSSILSLTLLTGACNKQAVKEETLVGGPALNAEATQVGYDDGTQMLNRFRINYAGYLPLQEKIAVYLYDGNKKSVSWEVIDGNNKRVLQGQSNEYRKNDHASGDSFFLIDFSDLQKTGDDYRLRIGSDTSKTFAIGKDVYQALKFEFFDYFQDHRREGDVFDRYVHDWNDYSVTLNFIADAGDQGYYPVNAAEAQWALISMLERYPHANDYYSNAVSGMSTLYDELVFFNYPMDKIIIPGQKLAIAKWHTNSNDTWAICTGASGKGGSCVSRPATKATYSVARTLASMSRLHADFGEPSQQKAHYEHAKMAYKNAISEPLTCLMPNDVGGEGGYYPNNDNWSLWREPRTHRDPCASGPKADPKDNNVNDDQYTALVELFLAAHKLGLKHEATMFQKKMEAHPHHNRVDLFWWGAVSTEGTLSLLINRPSGVDLSQAESNLFAYADQVLEYQQVGYPGVTFDTQSDFWDADDRDDVDNNFRWGSNRMQLNDARILAFAAELAMEKKAYEKAIAYTNGTLKVMDQMSGTNAVALAMYTADSYPHIEHAVSRTHDALVPDTEDGKMALGANNWTLSNDPNMPAFGTEPGMKMFALNGTGWASREISVDGNASLVPVAYFATEVAPTILEQAYKALAK